MCPLSRLHRNYCYNSEMNNVKKTIRHFLKGGDILFIVPPFGSINHIAFGPHILHALAEENGYKADILYLNILLASVIGADRYNDIYFSPEYRMSGERLFARAAHGLPPLGKHPEHCPDEAMSIRGSRPHPKLFYNVRGPFDLDMYLRWEAICFSFIEEAVPAIAAPGYAVAGCTASMTRQTNGSIALLSGLKKESPRTVTLMGGSNCKNEMAEGIASLSPAVDYVFSGEGETAFLDFLKGYSSGRLPPQRVIPGEPLTDLDTLPLVDYDIFLRQYAHSLGETGPGKTNLWYETGRGCWWAGKSQCAFCSEHHISYRQKSVNKAVPDLRRIGEAHPGSMLLMSDIVMPRSYRKELPPVIDNKEEFPSLGYQVRTSLDLEDLVNLKRAKVDAVLPGIESFSTPLLELMNKGAAARQSLLFLRNAACTRIYSDWLLLWGIPGDSVSHYREVLRILPLIRHLQPPRDLYPMILMRFSPYLHRPGDHKIENPRPWAVFDHIYPGGADIDKLAPYYTAEYPSGSLENPGIIREIAGEIDAWRKTWKQSELEMTLLVDTYFIGDGRGIGEEPKIHRLDFQRAREIMVSRPYRDSGALEWAVEEKLGVVVDSHYVPLVTASPELLAAFEETC